MARIDDMIERLTEPDAIAEYHRQIALDNERGKLLARGRSYAQIQGRLRSYGQRWSQIRLRRYFLKLGIPCQRCGSTEQLEVSHKLAIGDGGSDDPKNVEWLCHSCHVAYANPAFTG